MRNVNESSMVQIYPDKRLNDPCVQFWLMRKRWTISEPYGDWSYWHIIKGDTGGVAPLNADKLIDLYLSDPLSQDEVAQSHRKSVFASQPFL